MKIRQMKTNLKCSVWILVCFMLMLSAMLSAKAAGTHEVTITPNDYRGGEAIQEAFEAQGGKTPAYDMLTVKLEPGTYNITEALVVYGNTTIDATGSTINYVRNITMEGRDGKAPLITNSCDNKKGYNGAGNITIIGGTWDFQGREGQENYKCSMEAFRFMHGSNFTFQNLTMQNLYESHFITIEGVENVNISNCTFKDVRDITAKKEAIHIDCMHNDAMAPSNQAETVYDDTICNNITITNCTFDKVPRGLGTHIAVAGLYPSNMTFTNNTFTNITYEAIKAYHYKNVTISNNTIKNAGCGIKAYLYAEPADCDNDEEGNSNYLDALKGTKTEGVPANLNTVISDNVIQNVTDKDNGFGIQVAGNTDRVMNGITISGNKISPNGKGNASKLAGIYTKFVNSMKVIGNQVVKSGKTGILISDSSNVTANSNDIKNVLENGMIAQRCKKITFSANKVASSKKHSIYMVDSPNSKITANVVSKDKTGGICADKGCTKMQITGNTITSSGKNAVSVLSSKSVKIQKNTIKTAKNFGIFLTASNQSKILKNSIDGTGNSGIVSEKSTSSKVNGNKVSNAGKYGILFNGTVKSDASKNKIGATKDYALNYSNSSKNKKWNLKFQNISVKSGAKKVTGHTMVGLKVTVTANGKSKTSKTKPNGDFSIATKKLKKGTKVTIQVSDKLGNVATKNFTAK